jgi:hypothetical protein
MFWRIEYEGQIKARSDGLMKLDVVVTDKSGTPTAYKVSKPGRQVSPLQACCGFHGSVRVPYVRTSVRGPRTMGEAHHSFSFQALPFVHLEHRMAKLLMREFTLDSPAVTFVELDRPSIRLDYSKARYVMSAAAFTLGMCQ